jgi:D-alanyl-D-alanine carboxypeptidase
MKSFGISLILSLLLLWSCNGDRQQQQRISKLSHAIEQLDALCDTLEKHDKWMGSMLITHADSVVYSRQIGFRSMVSTAEGIKALPIEPDTKFRIGSVTKTITSIIILQLVEEGKLALNTSLQQFFPDLPEAEHITILHLLNHSSGIHDFINDKANRSAITHPISEKDLVEKILADGSDFKVGETNRYSNPNFLLLGFIIEKITGNSYSTEFAQRIYTPLKLKHSAYGKAIDSTSNEAFSYSNRRGRWEKARITDIAIPGAAGSLTSTTNEVAACITALFEGKLLSQPMLDRMVQAENKYGLGIFREPLPDGSYFYTHGGHIDQFYANYIHLPERQLTVVTMSNGHQVTPDILNQAFIAYLFEQRFEHPQFHSRALSEQEAKPFTGQYKSETPSLELVISYENEQVLAELVGRPTFAIRILNDSTLRLDRYEATLRFTERTGSFYQQLTLEQGDDTIRFLRSE